MLTELMEAARAGGYSDVVMLHEHRGEPGASTPLPFPSLPSWVRPAPTQLVLHKLLLPTVSFSSFQV